MNNLKANLRLRKEAVYRMTILGISEKTINDFMTDGKVNISIKGVMCCLDECQLNMISKFEAETGCMVYHVIQNDSTIGRMLTFLYVSNSPEEWTMEHEDLKAGTPMAYVVNIDNDIYSEFGSVRIQNYLGGLIRIG